MTQEGPNIEKSGWNIETEAHANKVLLFLQKYIKLSQEDKPDYRNELALSGTNQRVINRISDGTAKIISVEVLYENGNLSQIHAVVDAEGVGQNIDVYLTGTALADYLKG